MSLSQFSVRGHLATPLCIAIVFGLTAPGHAAERRCEWVGSPMETTTYGPWQLTDPGFFWDTHTRRCCSQYSGNAVWITTVLLRTCTGSAGIKIDTTGPGGEIGGSYSWSETILDSQSGPGTASGYRSEEKCVWGFTPARIGAVSETTIVRTIGSHQNLVNEFTGAQATFNGDPFPFGGTIRMDMVGPGPHTYMVVSDVPGTNPIDVLTFIISVLPSYTLADIGDADGVNPTSVARFTNNAPDSVAVDFRVIPTMIGLEAELLNNQQVVLPGESVDVFVEFYTAPGYVATAGQELFADVTAYEAHKDGFVLATATASAFAGTVVSAPATVPASLQLGQNAPNPFRAHTLVPFAAPATSRLELEIYDVQGRRVRTLAQPGSAGFDWYGHDDRGRPLPSGVYTYRLVVDGEPGFARKAVLLR